jgi:pimeloyl-ACP methyl ester carboxylesterase
MTNKVSVSGVSLNVVERGKGQPLLFLHGGDGLGAERPWLDALAKQYRVIAPNHPGWGGSELPRWVNSVDDLAYLYLDLAEQYDLQDAVIVGNSFGGWIAAEMLVRDASRFSHAVLAAPFGCKFGPRTVREITDMHAVDQVKLRGLLWADPALGVVDFPSQSDETLTHIVQGREAFALFGWKPYMHNPRLARWLHRIPTPTLLLRGEADGIVGDAYMQNWAGKLPNAQVQNIAGAGHYPHWEQPAAFAAQVAGFAKS